MDSIDAIEISTLMENAFALRVTIDRLTGLHTVADAIDLLLGYEHASESEPASDYDAPVPLDSTSDAGRREWSS